MKKLLLAALVLIGYEGHSQIVGGNVIKVNMSSAAIGHYMLSYERAVGLNRSVAIAVGYSNGVDLPFKSTLIDQFGDNEDAKNAIESTKFDKLTITPEYRFYAGTKGAPIGFYLATFMRYTKMSFTQDYIFNHGSHTGHVAKINGTLNGVGAGAMIGMQWALGSSLTFDWWILGPFAGIQDGKFDGVSDFTDMSAEDKADLEADIESVEIPLWDIEATVGNNTIDAEINGPFYGVRMFGFSLGYRF